MPLSLLLQTLNPAEWRKGPGKKKKKKRTHNLCKECVATIIFPIHKLVSNIIQRAKAPNAFKSSKDAILDQTKKNVSTIA